MIIQQKLVYGKVLAISRLLYGKTLSSQFVLESSTGILWTEEMFCHLKPLSRIRRGGETLSLMKLTLWRKL